MIPMAPLIGELHVHDLSKEGDHHKYFVAYKDRVFIVSDASKMNKVIKHLRQHPSFKRDKKDYDPLQDTTPHNVMNTASEYSPDIVAGYYNEDDGSINVNTGADSNPKSSLLVKKIAKQLRLNSVTKQKTSFDGESDDTLTYSPDELDGGVPKIVFHGTTASHLNKILHLGLDPGRGESNWKRTGVFNYEHIFFAATFDIAEYYAHNAVAATKGYDNYPIVIEFTVPDPAKLGPDYDADRLSTKDNHFNGPKHKHGKSDMSSMGLSREVGKWSYNGRIPPKFIRWVYYLNRDEGKWKKSKPSTWRKLLLTTDWEVISYRLGMQEF
jgi:hypothetical protein